MTDKNLSNNFTFGTKRALDLFIAVTFLLVTSPFIFLILIIVAVITKQYPILKQQRRITLDKQRIKIYKIKTIKDSLLFRELEKNSKEVFEKNEYEDFVPPLCKWLRKSGWDEILQLINVIKGEMSLVGPRPLIEYDLKIMKTNEPNAYLRRKNIKSQPGITGCWQVWGDRTKGADNLIYFDEHYEKNKSFLLDSRILFETFVIVLTAKHSDSIVPDKQIKTKIIYRHSA